MGIDKECFKNTVSLVFRQVDLIYTNTGDERKKLNAEDFCKEDTSFSPLFEIEMFSELISGYAYTLGKYGKIDKDANKIIDELNNSDIFNNECFLQWFLNNENKYPNICLYILMLDYLRIKLINFLGKEVKERERGQA